MGKKTTHNAYYYFMTELRDRQPQQYPNLQAVSEVAGRLWQQMSHAQRQPYVDMASKRKNSGVRYTSTGVSIDEIKKRQQEAALKEQQMKDDIKQTINMAAATNRLQEQVFHIIHTNYFYHQSFVKYYVPAEIAVARFTLADGVKPENVFHMMIHPGQVERGYRFECIDISKKTHQIPIPPDEDAPENREQVFSALLRFMKMESRNGIMPPIYADTKHKEIVENILETMCLTFGESENTFKIYSLDYMFYELRNAVAKQIVYPTFAISSIELDKDIYAFCREITCKYHAHTDVPQYCSKSYVTRYAYIICDNCCADLNITLIPGTHVPLRSKISSVIRKTPSDNLLDEACGIAGSSATTSVLDSDWESSETDHNSSTRLNEWNIVGNKRRSQRVESSTCSLNPVSSNSILNMPNQQRPSPCQSSTGAITRRPNTLSAALTGGAANLSSMSDGTRTKSIGRGRGSIYKS